MFFTARSDGVLDAWDYYLNGQNEPALSTQARSPLHHCNHNVITIYTHTHRQSASLSSLSHTRTTECMRQPCGG